MLYKLLTLMPCCIYGHRVVGQVLASDPCMSFVITPASVLVTVMVTLASQTVEICLMNAQL